MDEVVSHDPLPGPDAGLDDLPGRQNRLQAQDIIPGRPVFDAGGPAGIGGRVSPDGAGVHAGRVGGIEKSPPPGGLFQVFRDDPRFHDGDEVFFLQGKNPVHFRQGQDDTAVGRHGPAGQACSQPPGRDGKTMAVGQPENRPDFLR